MPSSPAISRRQATNFPTNTQRLSKHGSQWAGEIIPDSEEERQEKKVPLEVIEISSDEDDTLCESPSSDDPFSIPNSRPANNLSKKSPSAVNATIPYDSFQGRSVNATPRKIYRSRRIVESSSESEESDAGRKTQRTVRVDPDIIELSDSSFEIPTTITPTRPTDTRRQPTISVLEQPLHSGQEDASDNEGAILTLDEPKSARKPIRLSALTQGSVNLPISAIPGNRAWDERKGSLTVNARPGTLFETPGRRGLPSMPSTPKAGAKPKQASLTGQKAQAAAEQGRRERYAQELFSELNHSVFHDGLPKETKLNWNKRLLTTAGRAKWHRSREGVQTTEIELAEKILDCDERIRNTLSHEMCHLACWIIDAEPKEGHGSFFKAWATRVMRKRPEIEITTRHDYEISHPYEWKCQKCAKIYGRFSKSIDPDKCLCGACNEGRLVPLFKTRTSKPSKTPRTSKMASTRPQDSPQSIPRPSTSTRADYGSPNDPERDIHSIHDSGSESDSDIAILTSTMRSITIVASEAP